MLCYPRGMRAGEVLLVLLLCLGRGCSGGEVDRGDSGTADVNRFDVGVSDRGHDEPAAGDGSSDGGGAGDGASDGGQDAPSAADLGGCSSWSAWSCQAEGALLCTATCGELALSCTNNGDCLCGIGGGSCGNFSGTSPCDVCQKAWLGGCCE